MRGAWIEMASVMIWMSDGMSSLPVRGAWIEISPSASSIAPETVAPRAGSVD